MCILLVGYCCHRRCRQHVQQSGAFEVQCDNAWSDIDVQLKRRYDLIPNLVETVKGYAAHEKGTLEGVVQARNAAMSAQGPAAKAQAEGMLTSALRQVFALAEAYPQLRAVESFNQLQQTLNQSKTASRTRGGITTPWCVTSIQKSPLFPSNIIAGMFNFKPREFFEIARRRNAKCRRSASAERKNSAVHEIPAAYFSPACWCSPGRAPQRASS